MPRPQRKKQATIAIDSSSDEDMATNNDKENAPTPSKDNQKQIPATPENNSSNQTTTTRTTNSTPNSGDVNQMDPALQNLDKQVNNEEEEEEATFRPTSFLETVGISKQDITKLMVNGYTTVDSIAYTTQKDLNKINGFYFMIGKVSS